MVKHTENDMETGRAGIHGLKGLGLIYWFLLGNGPEWRNGSL